MATIKKIVTIGARDYRYSKSVNGESFEMRVRNKFDPSSYWKPVTSKATKSAILALAQAQ